MEKESKKNQAGIARKIFLPLFIFLSFVGFYVFYRIKVLPFLPIHSQEIFRKHSLALLIVTAAVFSQRIIAVSVRWYKKNISSKTATELDDRFMPIFERTAKIIIWIIASLIILPLYGINVTVLITTLGVSSLAIALAAQDTIANVISGFLIMIDEPFRIGDTIKLPSGEVVVVLDIGIRRSKFLAEDTSIVIVPNVDLSKSKIVNYTYGKTRAQQGEARKD